MLAACTSRICNTAFNKRNFDFLAVWWTIRKCRLLATGTKALEGSALVAATRKAWSF